MKGLTPVLTTKLHFPRLGSGIVRRERLLEALDHAMDVPLALVSAPPGYGKTVLAVDWARARGHEVAWLSLDEQESGLQRFMTCLLASMRQARPGAFPMTARALGAAELPSVERIIRLMASEAAGLDADLVIVLDDYHCLHQDSPVHEILRQLIAHPPPRLHFVLLTRRDPPFPLSRLRANEQVVELRVDMLRFRADETGAFLAAALGREVDAEAAADAQGALEGWGAGLRMISLAAASVGGNEFRIRDLPGGLQQIHEYLFDEVIQGLEPERLHSLLLSALPRRFTAELVDAMAADPTDPGRDGDGEAFIRFVDRNNMFTLSQDAEGRWFRFHSLFRALLLQRLSRALGADERSGAVLRAGGWLEAEGLIEDALRILVEDGQWSAAATVVERHRLEALDQDQWMRLDGWFNLFPQARLVQWPSLLLAKASLAMFHFDMDLLMDLLRQLETHAAEDRLSPTQHQEVMHFSALPQFWSGDIAGARNRLEQVDARLLGSEQLRGEFEIYLAMSRAMTGDLEVALDHLDQVEAASGGRRNIFAGRLMAARSFIRFFALQPTESGVQADRMVLLTASELDLGHVRGWGWYMRVLCLLGTGRFETALGAVAEAQACAEHIETRILVELELAKAICAVHLGRNDVLGEATDALAEFAESVTPGTGLPELVRSAQARIALLRGLHGPARELAAELPREASAGTLVLWLEEPAITWARVQLSLEGASGVPMAAELLTRFRALAQEQRLVCQAVELRLLEAVALFRMHRPGEAARAFAQSVDLAHEAGWVRPFAEMAEGTLQLSSITELGDAQRAFIAHALRHANDERRLTASTSPQTNGPAPEPLTNRELDVLELLADRRRNKEIARALYISTNTVGYHLKNAFRKLGVSDRREAVLRARDLGLIGAD